MASPQMTATEWHRRLADNFSMNGVIGGNLTDLEQYETQAGNNVIKNFGGGIALLDSIMGFFLTTLEFAEGQVLVNGWPKDKPNFVRLRKDTEQLISDRLVRKHSGLAPEVQDDLATWHGFSTLRSTAVGSHLCGN